MRYDQLLKDGAVATGAYVPKSVPLKGDKAKIVNRYKETYETLLSKLSQWSEDDLDKYFLPHPLLGRVTVREMMYFTVHHIAHHRNTFFLLR